MYGFLRILNVFFSTWRFPVFTVSTLGFTAAMLATILALPPGDTALGAFAEDFKIWCFGYDPATGELEWAYVMIFLFQPLLLAVATAAMWSDTFREAFARPRQSLPYALAGLSLVGVSAVALAAMQPEVQTGDLPFPAESLRTQITAPDFALVDQDEAPVELRSLHGKVVLVTAVYASCGMTCPSILRDAKSALAELTEAERSQVVVVGISLDPARDTPAVLATLANAQGVAAPAWHLLTGDPARVESTLHDFGFAWERDPATGRIDHASMFMLVDRDGRVAYRLSVGERRQRWLVSALQTLVAEAS